MDEICHVETDKFNKALYATNKLFTKPYEATGAEQSLNVSTK